MGPRAVGFKEKIPSTMYRTISPYRRSYETDSETWWKVYGADWNHTWQCNGVYMQWKEHSRLLLLPSQDLGTFTVPIERSRESRGMAVELWCCMCHFSPFRLCHIGNWGVVPHCDVCHNSLPCSAGRKYAEQHCGTKFAFHSFFIKPVPYGSSNSGNGKRWWHLPF